MKWDKFSAHIPIILIIILAVFFRFVYLGTIPNALGGDELHYALTAKAVFFTGRDISGSWHPLSALVFRYPPNEGQAELPYFLHLLASAPFPFSLFMFKLPFALLGTGTVLLLYAIANLLFGPAVGIAVGLVAAMNPWLVVMDRTGYEAAPAAFFYMLALYVVLKARSWKILWAIIPLLFAFYSYIATKVIFVPFVLAASLLAFFKQKRQFAKQYVILCGISVAIVVVFFLLFKTNPNVTRLNDIFLPNSSMVADQVNEIRKTAIQSTFLPLVVNKYTMYLRVIASKLFRIFSPEYLFVEGDQFFLPVSQSFFYWLDAVFLFMGAVYLFAKKKIFAWIIGLFVLIGTFPHLVNTTMGDFSIHLTLMFPFLVLVIGAGVAETLQNLPKRFFIPALLTIILLYTANVANFSVGYFGQYPLTGDADFPMRILTKYVVLARNSDKRVIVYAAGPGDLFQKYIYYSDSITRTNIPLLATRVFSQEIEFEGMRFLPCDAKKARDGQSIIVYDRGCGVKIEEPRTAIASLMDGGEAYKILDDSVCSNYQLTRYPERIGVGDFAIEKLAEKHFCEKYVSIR